MVTPVKENMLRQELHRAVNELCLNCGKYREEYKGACDGCHFKDVKENKELWGE